jgi:uncharacterized membrane protein
MSMHKPSSCQIGLLVAAAVTVAAATLPAQAADSEKCYGVAKAGKNDCKTDTNSCAGQAKGDHNPMAFIALPAGTCEKLAGGSLTPMKK